MTINAELGGDYPMTWDGMVGQHQAKRQLITAAKSAKIRSTRMDHVLIADSTPGVGKTTLALLTAIEMGVKPRIVSGKISVGEARMIFATMRDNDVLIIDEIHLMVAGGKKNAEWLLHYLQDGVIVGPRGPEKVPAVTIIGCTTDAGKLPETILDRFMIRPVITPYTEEEAACIAMELSGRIFRQPMPIISSANAYAVGTAASRNPRVMRSILTYVRDIGLTTEMSNFDTESSEYDIDLALEWLGLSADGLTPSCVKYLVTLLEDFYGEPAGAAALADRLQETGGLGYTERLLMDKGLIVKTPKGRMLSPTGIQRAMSLGSLVAV